MPQPGSSGTCTRVVHWTAFIGLDELHPLCPRDVLLTKAPSTHLYMGLLSPTIHQTACSRPFDAPQLHQSHWDLTSPTLSRPQFKYYSHIICLLGILIAYYQHIICPLVAYWPGFIGVLTAYYSHILYVLDMRGASKYLKYLLLFYIELVRMVCCFSAYHFGILSMEGEFFWRENH